MHMHKLLNASKKKNKEAMWTAFIQQQYVGTMMKRLSGSHGQHTQRSCWIARAVRQLRVQVMKTEQVQGKYCVHRQVTD